MTTEITVTYRPDGTCEFLTVQLPDKAGPNAVTRMVKVLAGISTNSDTAAPEPCGHQWTTAADWETERTDWITTCTLPAGHDGPHLDQTDIGQDVPLTAGICCDLRPVRNTNGWAVRDGVCQLRAGHMSDHEDNTQAGLNLQWPRTEPEESPC